MRLARIVCRAAKQLNEHDESGEVKEWRDCKDGMEEHDESGEVKEWGDCKDGMEGEQCKSGE